MPANHFYEIIAGHEDEDFRATPLPGLDYGPEPLVSVWVSVYNHEKYLRQCLDGVMMQRTDFPFEVIVTDDASTDGSPHIIREYAERFTGLIRPVLGKTNLYSKGRKRFVEQFLCLRRGKYFTVCEGDDYWTDPARLQKMADFMESHPAHSLCFHAYDVKSEIVGWQPRFPMLKRERDVGVFEIAIEHHIQFAAIMGRANALSDDASWNDDYNSRRFAYGSDIRLYLAMLNAGRVHGFPEKMSAYRIHAGGVATNAIITGAAHRQDMELLAKLSPLYGGKYGNLVNKRLGFLDLRERLDRWTYARRDKKLLLALTHLCVACCKHPRLFVYTYYHRYIH